MLTLGNWKVKKMLHQDPNLELSTSRRIIIFVFGILDSMMFGGAVFGWPQLVYILKNEGIYSNLCDKTDDFTLTDSNLTMQIQNGFNNPRCSEWSNTSTTTTLLNDTQQANIANCLEQDGRLALIYTISVLCFGVPGIAIGFLLHYAGLRITRLLGGFMVTASFLCLSLTTTESPNFLFPAMMLLGAGGNTLRLSCMQFGDLFPKFRTTAITVLTGVYSASASLFLLFTILASFGISRITVCYILSGIAFTSALFSFIMPWHHIPFEEEEEEEVSPESKQETSEKRPNPLMNSLKTLSSLLHQYWFFIGLFCVNVYQETYDAWVTGTACSTDEAGFYTRLFSIFNFASMFLAPLGGIFTDYMIRKARENTSDKTKFLAKEVQANFFPLFVTTICEIFMYLCLLFFHPAAIIVSLAMMIVVRPCIFAISTAYLRIRFPADHFNRLLGIYSTVASVLLCVQYPHFQWAEHMYYLAHGLALILLILSLSNPFHLLMTSHIRKAVTKRDILAQDNSIKMNGVQI